MANNYLGEPNKLGKQFDYSDYAEQVQQQLWSLQDKDLNARFKELDLADVWPNGVEDLRTPVINFKLGIRWDLIAQSAQRRIA